jgi:2-hydroxychromene-2-carboxylate isomerase
LEFFPQASFTAGHAAGICPAFFMVIAQQVQIPVHQQPIDLGTVVFTCGLCLPCRGRQGKYDITQYMRLDPAEAAFP